MSVFINALSGQKILEETDSPINGKLTVIKDLAWGVHIMAGGITQSGGVVVDVWKSTLKKVKNTKKEVKKCLILGLGGGTTANLVRGFWKDSRIVGVDADPVIVELGKKYLGLENSNVKIVIGDANPFCKKKTKEKYDLILVDTYLGQEFPKSLESEDFLMAVKRLLPRNGIIIFNRLYFQEKRPPAMKFLARLEKIFRSVEAFYPEANVMFICLD